MEVVEDKTNAMEGDCYPRRLFQIMGNKPTKAAEDEDTGYPPDK